MKDNKNLGYILGTILAAVIAVCGMAIIIALTCKFISFIM